MRRNALNRARSIANERVTCVSPRWQGMYPNGDFGDRFLKIATKSARLARRRALVRRVLPFECPERGELHIHFARPQRPTTAFVRTWCEPPRAWIVP